MTFKQPSPLTASRREASSENGGADKMSRAPRYAYAALGTICVALGILGVVVPGLPTTVFVIAASWLYSRSCPALDRWMRRTRWLGEALARFEESRAMTVRAKAVALGSMWTGIAFGVAVTAAMTPIVPAAMVVSGLVGSGVILSYVRTASTLTPSRAAAQTR
jgi:hypothetical protein